MNLSNQLTELLGIDYPILQAPMGGESTPEMASAVAIAGGLGGLGCSYLSAEEIETKVGQIRAATDLPFNLNFFAHAENRHGRDLDPRTRARLDAFYAELGLDEIPAESEIDCHGFDGKRLNLVLALRPRVVSFHFGLPSREMLHVLQEAGIVVICSATTVAEAVWLDEAGVDAIIAQGWEAGGHRGTFDVTGEGYGVGTLALVPQVVDAVGKPVIAAGGIADGRGIAAALVLGAQGVQLGTAFLACPEANISDAYRKAVHDASAEETRLSRAFSGRPARVRNNRYVEAMERERLDYPGFPHMYRYSYPLEKAAIERGKSGFECYIFGQAARLNRALPAAELVALLVEETRSALAHCR
jgi:nitronate monooxygenase